MTHDTLAAALAAVQAELPRVDKNRTAEVRTKDGGSYSYKYADLADVSAAIMPLLGKHGLAFTARPTVSENGAQFGLHYELLHESGASITGWYPIQPGSPQQTGGLITYARRYCLCAVTGVAAEEDIDARDAATPRRPQQRANAESPPQRTAQRRQAPATQQSAANPPDDNRSAASPVTMPPLPGEDEHIIPMVTGAQLTKIHLQMRDIGYVDDSQKAERLQLASRIVGRGLESSKELTRQEASRLIDFIEKHGTDYPALEAALNG